MFVLPDNRALAGKLYISSFRVYFRSNVNYFKHKRLYLKDGNRKMLEEFRRNKFFNLKRRF